MKRFKNILLVSDRGTIGQAALERAVSLAKTNGARLTVAEVIEELPRDMRMFITLTPPEDLEELAVREHRDHLDGVVEPIRQQDVQVAVEVMTGTPFIQIIRRVLSEEHDLVLMTAEGESGLRDRLFGSTSLHLMRKCPCPVWVMKPTGDGRFARIIAAVDVDAADETRTSLNTTIMELAASLAELEQCELHVVHAWTTWPQHFLRDRVRMPPAEVDRLAQQVLALRKKQLDDLVDAYFSDASRHHVHFLIGEARTAIPELVAAKGADLVVMGTVCRTGLAGFFIGNTAEEVLQKVDCSVLVVKPGGFVSPVEPGRD